MIRVQLLLVISSLTTLTFASPKPPILSFETALPTSTAPSGPTSLSSSPPVLPSEPSQPVPEILIANPSLPFYHPTGFTPENGIDPAVLPPPNTSTINPLEPNAWFGTTLFGYDECAQRGLDSSKIKDAYYDMWYLTNQDNVAKNIDWNSAAALEFLGAPGLNVNSRATIQKYMYLASQVSAGWVSGSYIHVRCDDAGGKCPMMCDPNGGFFSLSDTVAYSWQSKDGYSTINFCPKFFNKRRLRNDAIDYGKSQPGNAKFDASNYDNSAHTFLHELLHRDPFMEATPEERVTDLKISVQEEDPRHPGRPILWLTQAYGALHSKILARFLPHQQDHPTGYYVQRNADNMAWFATTMYVQRQIGAYPHIPIAQQLPEGPPITLSRPDAAYYWGTPGNFTFLMDNATMAEEQFPCGEEHGQIVPDVNITNFVPDSAYPSEYIANRTAWVKTLAN